MSTFVCLDGPPDIPLRRSKGQAKIPCVIPQGRPFTVEGFTGGGRRFTRLSIAKTRHHVSPCGIHVAGADAKTVWYEVTR
jgi:hypothetical protein